MFSSASRAQFWREKKINNWKIGEKNLKAQCEPPLKNYRLTISGNRHRSYEQWTGCVVCGVCVCIVISHGMMNFVCFACYSLTSLQVFVRYAYCTGALQSFLFFFFAEEKNNLYRSFHWFYTQTHNTMLMHPERIFKFIRKPISLPLSPSVIRAWWCTEHVGPVATM